jgi:hypothetical protein
MYRPVLNLVPEIVSALHVQLNSEFTTQLHVQCDIPDPVYVSRLDPFVLVFCLALYRHPSIYEYLLLSVLLHLKTINLKH